MAASVRRLRSRSSEVRRRDVLLAVLSASRKKHGGGGVLLKNTCDEMVPRGAADAKTAHRAVKQYLQEAVDFGVLTKDSGRRYRFTDDVCRYAEVQGNTASKNKKKKRSKNGQADVEVGAGSGSSTSAPSASEADAGAATLTSDVAPVADEITVEMLRVNIGGQRGDERLDTTREDPVDTGDADQCTEEVVFDLDVVKDESKDPLFCAKLEETSSPAPTVIHLESGHNHEEDVKLFN